MVSMMLQYNVVWFTMKICKTNRPIEINFKFHKVQTLTYLHRSSSVDFNYCTDKKNALNFLLNVYW